MMGSPQPRTSNWSKRRSIRRLQLASLRRMIVFTRNPSRNTVFEEPVTLSNTGKPEGFHIFQTFLAERADAFACLRSRSQANRREGRQVKTLRPIAKTMSGVGILSGPRSGDGTAARPGTDQ